MSDNISKYDAETEVQRQLNDYNDFIDAFIDNFSADIFSSGIISDITPEDLQQYFKNPDRNIDILSDITEYFYISTGEIHMLFELLESLPTLNYRIESFEQPANHDKYVSQINKTLHKVKHKRLTRDIIKQTASDGTLTGIWLGNKNNLYPYIFDSPKYAFPAYRRNGEWVVNFDLEYIDKKFKDFGKKVFFQNLSPYITEQQYNLYVRTRSEDHRYVELPQNRSFVVNTHTLKRNQGLGTGWANSALFDILHKRKLKNVEQSIANKIINAIAILTIGSDKLDGKYANLQLGRSVKQKITAGVKKALEKSKDGNVPVVGIPEFATLEFPDVKADGLDGKKFEHVNDDIQSSVGVSSAIVNGKGGNNASSKMNISVFYRRIGVLLENIESDMYQKMINIILPVKERDNYYMVYDKDQPLTTKEQLDALSKLADKGWSVKHLVNKIGLNFEQYLEQTLLETEEMRLQERIKPYQTSFTMTSEEELGAPKKSDDEISPEGESTRTSGKNEE